MNADLASAKFQQRLRGAVVGAFFAMLALATLLPVYSDEIGWRFQERAGIDGVDKMYNDLCGPNTLAVPPWFMMPVRWFSAAANQAFADPLFIRLEGVICAIAWGALVWLLVARIQPGPARVRLQTLTFALLGLGTLPLLLVMSRPEQPLIISLTLMMLIALSRSGGAVLAWLKSAAIVMLAGVALSYHLKGVAYAPVALVCLWLCAAGRRTIAARVTGMAALIAMTAAGADYWASRFRCTGDAALASKLSGENLASALSGDISISDAASQLIVGLNPLTYVWLAVPDNQPMSEWLPENLFPAPVYWGFAVVVVAMWSLAFVASLWFLVRFVREQRWAALREPRTILAATILACLLVWGASQVNRNVYEATHVLPMLALFVALCLSLPPQQPVRAWRSSGLVAATGIAALASQLALLAFVAGPLIRAAQKPGPLPDQAYSVSIAGYDGVRADVAAAMTQAGLDPRETHTRLMVDDVTYLALQRHPLPFHRLGVVEVWNGSIDNPAGYLVSRDSAGAVMACRNLPMEMEPVAVRSGDICALARPHLEEIAAPPEAIWDEE